MFYFLLINEQHRFDFFKTITAFFCCCKNWNFFVHPFKSAIFIDKYDTNNKKKKKKMPNRIRVLFYEMDFDTKEDYLDF